MKRNSIAAQITGTLLSASVFLTFGLGSAPAALAAKPAKATKVSQPDLLKAMFSTLHSVDQLELYNVMSGMPAADAEAINADLSKRADGTPFPELALVHDEILVNGAKTGIWVDPHGPTRIRYQGRGWRFDKNSSYHENYVTLVKFLTPAGTTTSFLDHLIPSAEATEKGEILGGITGAIGTPLFFGAIAVILTGVGAPEGIIAIAGMFAMGGVAVGGIAGVEAGGQLSDRKEIVKALKNVQGAGKIEVSCSDSVSTIRITTADGRHVRIEFRHHTPDHYSSDLTEAAVVDEKDGHAINRSTIAAPDALYQSMVRCRSGAAAQTVASGLNHAVALATDAWGHPIDETNRTAVDVSPAEGSHTADPAK